jgi:hypothetical protein
MAITYKIAGLNSRDLRCIKWPSALLAYTKRNLLTRGLLLRLTRRDLRFPGIILLIDLTDFSD